jgi:hypothetical protein
VLYLLVGYSRRRKCEDKLGLLEAALPVLRRLITRLLLIALAVARYELEDIHWHPIHPRMLPCVFPGLETYLPEVKT